MSVLTLYMFDIPVSKGGPDVIGLILLLGLVFSLLIISRTAKYLAGSYLVLAVPIIFGEFFYWLFFNGSQPGAKMTFYLWPGFLPIGVSTLVLVGVFSLVYYKTRSIGWSLVAGLLLWWFTIMPSAISFSSAATWAKNFHRRRLLVFVTSVGSHSRFCKSTWLCSTNLHLISVSFNNKRCGDCWSLTATETFI